MIVLFLTFLNLSQAFQESSYQAFVATKAKEKSNQLEHYYEQLISKTQQEISCILLQLSNLRTEFSVIITICRLTLYQQTDAFPPFL